MVTLIKNKFFNPIWLKGFVFEQKCMPWILYKEYCKMRNKIVNINTAEYWNDIWSKINNNLAPKRLSPVLFGKILSLIEHNKKVVDVGCGVGVLLEMLKKDKECDVFGVDISHEAINTLTKKGIRSVTAKVPPIPLSSASFDVVIATELLEHVNNPHYLIKELIRLLKPFGNLIISVPDETLFPHSYREHVAIFNEKKLLKLFKNFKDINKAEVFKVKEQEGNITRLILRAKKCQK